MRLPPGSGEVCPNAVKPGKNHAKIRARAAIGHPENPERQIGVKHLGGWRLVQSPSFHSFWRPPWLEEAHHHRVRNHSINAEDDLDGTATDEAFGDRAHVDLIEAEEARSRGEREYRHCLAVDRGRDLCGVANQANARAKKGNEKPGRPRARDQS